MNVGTKSILFGVHAFWWHPFTVAAAWRKLYGRWPNWAEWVAILFHDNYWGLPNIDGPEGKEHPARNALLARLFGGPQAEELVRFHSRSFASAADRNPSALCAPDKASILLEPRWFYLCRARLSGEIKEFVRNEKRVGGIPEGATEEQWLNQYMSSVEKEFVNVIYLPLSNGEFAIVDSDCPAKILTQKWSACAKTPGRTYAFRTLRKDESSKKTHRALHTEILGCDGEEVDHKNGNTLDNRRANLRACPHWQNGQNLRKWTSPTSAKFKGVSRHKSGWRAYISFQRVQKHLGTFQTEESAAKAYDQAATDLFGEFARLNFPK